MSDGDLWEKQAAELRAMANEMRKAAKLLADAAAEAPADEAVLLAEAALNVAKAANEVDAKAYK